MSIAALASARSCCGPECPARSLRIFTTTNITTLTHSSLLARSWLWAGRHGQEVDLLLRAGPRLSRLMHPTWSRQFIARPILLELTSARRMTRSAITSAMLRLMMMASKVLLRWLLSVVRWALTMMKRGRIAVGRTSDWREKAGCRCVSSGPRGSSAERRRLLIRLLSVGDLLRRGKDRDGRVMSSRPLLFLLALVVLVRGLVAWHSAEGVSVSVRTPYAASDSLRGVSRVGLGPEPLVIERLARRQSLFRVENEDFVDEVGEPSIVGAPSAEVRKGSVSISGRG